MRLYYVGAWIYGWALLRGCMDTWGLKYAGLKRGGAPGGASVCSLQGGTAAGTWRAWLVYYL